MALLSKKVPDPCCRLLKFRCSLFEFQQSGCNLLLLGGKKNDFITEIIRSTMNRTSKEKMSAFGKKIWLFCFHFGAQQLLLFIQLLVKQIAIPIYVLIVVTLFVVI